MAAHGPLSVLALARTNEVKGALLGALEMRSDTVLDVEVGELRTVNGAWIERVEKADILLLDVDASDEQELAILRRIVEEHRKRASILATAQDITAVAVRQLVRQGVDDFIPQPIGTDDVLDALNLAARRLRQRRSGDRPPGKVLGFMRAKGGVGATTLALHAALSLQTRRRREPEKHVCVLDLDLQFGDAALLLDLDVKQEILEIIRSPQRLDGALLRGAMVQHRSGLMVLPAPIQPVPLEALHQQTATQLIELAREEFDYVVVDLPLALAQWVEPVLAALDRILVVTQLNVPAIRGTRRLLDVLHDEGLLNLPVSIVLNRYAWRLGQGSRLKQATKALGRPIDFFVPDNEQLVLEAANRGQSIYDVRRRSRIGRAIATMADRCVRQLAQQDGPRAGAEAA